MKWWYENEEDMPRKITLVDYDKEGNPFHRDVVIPETAEEARRLEECMEFDKSRIYTALNADELRAGDKVIGGNTLADLKYKVGIETIDTILDEGETYRFTTKEGEKWLMVLLVERKENCTNCKYSNPHKNLLYCEDDNIPIHVGGEKLSVCDKYEPKTEQKAEGYRWVNYRPFKNVDELIQVWDAKIGTPKWGTDGDLTMPLIWVRNKENKRVWLITEFDNRLLDYLFTNCEFLDGSPCGVEE